MAATIIGIIAGCACLFSTVFASRDFDGLGWRIASYLMLYVCIQSIYILVLLAVGKAS